MLVMKNVQSAIYIKFIKSTIKPQISVTLLLYILYVPKMPSKQSCPNKAKSFEISILNYLVTTIQVD